MRMQDGAVSEEELKSGTGEGVGVGSSELGVGSRRDSYLEPGGWMTQEVYEQLTLFTQQLSGRVIGLTCGGFFLLTKEMLLTLASVLVTFYAMIIQMDMGAPICTCACRNPTTTAAKYPAL